MEPQKVWPRSNRAETLRQTSSTIQDLLLSSSPDASDSFGFLATGTVVFMVGTTCAGSLCLFWHSFSCFAPIFVFIVVGISLEKFNKGFLSHFPIGFSLWRNLPCGGHQFAVDFELLAQFCHWHRRESSSSHVGPIFATGRGLRADRPCTEID